MFSARVGVPKNKMPDEIKSSGILFWRRPTLARPIAVLPSGLQRFTAVFGMGTGGATALLSPELNPESFRDSVLVNCRFQIVDCRLNLSDGHPLSPRLQRDKWTAATRSTLTFQR